MKWAPAIVMCVIIFAISSIHGNTVNSIGLGRESYHINGHFVLYMLLCIGFFKATKIYIGATVLSGLYALSDEFHQTFVPGRSWENFDLMVDGLGIALAIVIVWKIIHTQSNKLKNWLLS